MARARARLTLDQFKPATAPVAPVKGEREELRRGQTLRLRPLAHRQLNILAAEQGKHAHDLLIEATNLLFAHYGKPPIAD
jgi:hypothetical protein